MKLRNIGKTLFFLSSLILIITACNNAKDTKDTKPKDTIVRTKVKVEQKEVANRAPVINISDTLSIRHLVMCMKDSAGTSDRISMKLGEIYSVKLAAIIKKNGLKITGAPMAWYKSQKAPFFFEAGLPIDKKPKKIPAGVTFKQIGIDSVTVAHFYGPYKLTTQAYTALQEILKERKKKIILPPYEIYIDDAMDKNGKLKDPYKIQTDIVFTWK